MAATGSEMEVVLVAQASQLIQTMNASAAASAALARNIKDAFGAIPSVTNPAEQGITSLSESIKTYKAEQAGQARTVNFFVRELTEVVGLSKDAAGAVGGLGQVMLEAAAGGSAFAVGFEAAKFAVGQVVTEWRRGTEELHAFAEAQTIATGAVMEGKYALDKLMAGKGTEGDKAYRETFDAATKGAKDLTEQVEKMREKGPGIVAWVRAAFGDNAGLLKFEDHIAKAAGELDRLVASAKEYAEYARDFSGGYEESPAQRDAYWKIKADDFVKAEQERKQAQEKFEADAYKRGREEYDAWLRGWTEEAKRAAGVQAEIEKGILAQNLREAASYDAGTFDLSGVSASEVESKRIAKETEEQAKLARSLEQAWQDVGAAMTGAFGALSNAIGGAAGKFLSSIGEMISQAIKFAVAMAAASVAQTPVIGGLMAAAAAIGLATSLVATIASIPSYDVGTAYVPRTGLAMIHEGERIIPAAENRAMGSGGSNVTVNLNVTAMNGQDVYRTLTASRGELARVVREAVRDGVM